MKTGLLVLALAALTWCSVVAPSHAQESSPAARAALAHQLYDTSLAGLGSATRASDVYDWSVRWLRADLEAHTADAARAHFDRMSALLTRVHSLVTSGVVASSAETECRYYVAEARAWIAHPPAVP